MRSYCGYAATQFALISMLCGPSALAADKAEKLLKQHGTASYYSDGPSHKRTANGSAYHGDELTAASPTLPLGCKAKIVNRTNGKSVVVRVTDRGPHKRGRIIDVSQKAADQLGMKNAGLASVEVQARPSEQPTPALRREIAEKAAYQERAKIN
ncbi:MAG TPA: septal ring lytic transglycosylase RlpA family protein [Alphaproteobacteria bacterium]|nr:septal ring lytic transglycosylase RlpA family protein [Alphaproteobacteria bacterium]